MRALIVLPNQILYSFPLVYHPNEEICTSPDRPLTSHRPVEKDHPSPFKANCLLKSLQTDSPNFTGLDLEIPPFRHLACQTTLSTAKLIPASGASSLSLSLSFTHTPTKNSQLTIFQVEPSYHILNERPRYKNWRIADATEFSTPRIRDTWAHNAEITPKPLRNILDFISSQIRHRRQTPWLSWPATGAHGLTSSLDSSWDAQSFILYLRKGLWTPV